MIGISGAARVARWISTADSAPKLEDMMSRSPKVRADQSTILPASQVSKTGLSEGRSRLSDADAINRKVCELLRGLGVPPEHLRLEPRAGRPRHVEILKTDIRLS